MKKKNNAGVSIFVTTVLYIVCAIAAPFFDDSITGGQMFGRIAIAVVLGFAIFAISTTFEGRSSEKK